MIISDRTVLLVVLIFSILIPLSGCGDKKSGQDDNNIEQERNTRQLDYSRSVTFMNEDGNTISTIRAAVADEAEERNQGLMDVNNLPSDAGMLFIFPREQELSFYMANTPLPLDIIFVDSDSLIVRIHHSTSPYSDKQLLSGQPAQFVVETNGGYCVSNDIREGHKVHF